MKPSGHNHPLQPLPSHVQTILSELKEQVVAKYPLEEIRLFGSTVRGERRQDSDLDIFLRFPSLTRTIEEDVFDMAYELELKYDCLIDVILLSDVTLNACAHQLPVYQNILKEGIAI